jgi:hypothetical protein
MGNNYYRETKEIAEWLGWRFYEGTNTGEYRAYGDKMYRSFDPYHDIADAFVVVEKLIRKGYEFYLFYKQEDEVNAVFGSNNLCWIAEVREKRDSGYFLMGRVNSEYKCVAIASVIHMVAMRMMGAL